MKAQMITLVLGMFLGTSYAQNNAYEQFSGIWQFEPLPQDSGYFNSFTLFEKNKSLSIMLWLGSEEAYTTGSPLSYYGFWDTFWYSEGAVRPKSINELKSGGEYVMFFDDLVPVGSKSPGYDSLGNLHQPTRVCQWGMNDDLPEGLPTRTLSLYFNMEPDVYKKVDGIPDYVLCSLKNNKEDWKRYLYFVGHREGQIKQINATIYSMPDRPTNKYLLKGDEVEVLEEKDNWLRIRYYGKETIEGWIRKEDVE